MIKIIALDDGMNPHLTLWPPDLLTTCDHRGASSYIKSLKREHTHTHIYIYNHEVHLLVTAGDDYLF